MILRCESIAISFRYLRHRLFVPFSRPAKSRVPIKGNPDFKPAPTATVSVAFTTDIPLFSAPIIKNVTSESPPCNNFDTF